MTYADPTRDPSPGTHGAARCYGPAGPFLVTRTCHARGQTVGSHDHAPASLNFVLEGCYGETFRAKKESHVANTLVFKPPGAAHANHFDHAGARCLLIEVEENDLSAILKSRKDRLPRATRDPHLCVLAVRILHHTAEQDDTSSMVIEELTTALLQSMAGQPAANECGKVRKAEELLRETYTQPWSLSRVAHAVDLHPAHLGRAFRARVGCTVGEFVRNLRVLQVAREMWETEKPLAQIALEAGFADQSHCTRVFGRLVRETPARFRKQQRGASLDDHRNVDRPRYEPLV